MNLSIASSSKKSIYNLQFKQGALEIGSMLVRHRRLIEYHTYLVLHNLCRGLCIMQYAVCVQNHCVPWWFRSKTHALLQICNITLCIMSKSTVLISSPLSYIMIYLGPGVHGGRRPAKSSDRERRIRGRLYTLLYCRGNFFSHCLIFSEVKRQNM